MADLPAGWLTDLAVLRLGGARVTDRGDHLVVSSPDNPGYHWGNFLLVTDAAARDDATRWTAAFAECFPGADHLAIGLPAEPDPAAWGAVGLRVSGDDVLSTVRVPELRGAPSGVHVAPIVAADQWQAAVRATLDENARTEEHPAQEYRAFEEALARTRAGLVSGGVAAFFGAFVAGECVSQLGIVLCGPDAEGRQLARYQSVLTAQAHRGRGLAGHLVGVAARWAEDRGARRWVIVAEADSAAGRLYRSLGFGPDTRCWQAEGPATHT